MTTKQRKAKRKLSEIDFSSEGSHIALVHEDQGHGANNHHYAMLVKALDFSTESLEKMQQIRVTLSVPDFLSKFFNLYGSDAEVLARMMGYEKPEMEEDDDEVESYEDYIQSRLQSFEIMKSMVDLEDHELVLSELDEHQYLAFLEDQAMLEKAMKNADKGDEEVSEKTEKKKRKPKTVRSFVDPNAVVAKAVSTGDMVTWNSSGGTAEGKVKKIVTEGSVSIPGSSATLNASEENPAVLIQLYQDGKPTKTVVGHKMQTLKKISKSSENKESETAVVSKETVVSVEKTAEDDKPQIAGEVKEEVCTSDVKQELEKSMPDEIKTVEQEVTVEMVEKSALESIQKAFEEQKQQLEKALEAVAKFEAEKKEAITKARFEKVKAAVKDDQKAEVLFKAVSLVESEEDFDAVVKTLSDLTASVEQSDLFVEKGASVDEEPSVKESAVAKVLKAKLIK